MRTFINVLTTDNLSKNFNFTSYNNLPYTDKLTHIVRQCVGIKYLKLVYGKDLWFLFDQYKKEIELEFNSLVSKAKTHAFMKDNNMMQKIATAMTICNNALYENVTSYPILNIDDFAQFYGPSNVVPEFGSLTFVDTFYTHLKNINIGKTKVITSDGRGSILIPYNPMSKESAWKEVIGQSYEYDIKQYEAYASKLDISIDNILPFFTLIASIKNTVYSQNINSTLAVLASFMIDSEYVNDYCGYLTLYMNDVDKIKIAGNKKDATRNISDTTKDPNLMIYKGCFRILFDEIENSVFNNINSQCKCTLGINQRSGLSRTIIDNRTSKNLLWLISFINNNNKEFLNDNKLMTKLITYFEPKIDPNQVHNLLTILYKVPNITVEEYSFLAATTIGNLFSKVSPFTEEDGEDTEEEVDKDSSSEDEENKDDSEEQAPEEDAETDETSTDEETTDEETTDEPESSDDTELSEDEVDTTTETTPDEETVTDDQALPEYLLQLGSPPNLDNSLYRLEMDRVITLILKNPPKSMSSETIKILTNLQSYWLHLLTLPTLKLVLQKLIKS